MRGSSAGSAVAPGRGCCGIRKKRAGLNRVSRESADAQQVVALLLVSTSWLPARGGLTYEKPNSRS